MDVSVGLVTNKLCSIKPSVLYELLIPLLRQFTKIHRKKHGKCYTDCQTLVRYIIYCLVDYDAYARST